MTTSQKIRIKIIILIGLILGARQVCFAQDRDNTDKVKEDTKGGSSGTALPKKKIPNWKQEEKVMMEITQKLMEISPDSSKAVSGFGHSNETSKDGQFKEDKLRLGYPIGWTTNSSSPILRKDGKQIYIEINESISKVYLGKYIRTKPHSKYELILTFKNSFSVRLSLIEYDENNKKNSTLKIIELPQGEFKKYKIDLDISPATENLFIKFEKNANESFALKDFVCKGVGK